MIEIMNLIILYAQFIHNWAYKIIHIQCEGCYAIIRSIKLKNAYIKIEKKCSSHLNGLFKRIKDHFAGCTP